MKKYLLKSFALLAMLFSAMSISATQYCETSVASSVGGDPFLFTASKTGDLETTFKLTPTTTTFNDLDSKGTLYNVAAQNIGGGVTSTNWQEDWVLENNTLTKVVTWTTYPSQPLQLYIIARDSRDIIGATITDIDVSATCNNSGGSNTEAPVLTSVELFGAAQNFVLLTPTATDDKGVTSYAIAKSGGAETEVTPDATTGQIKIASLTLGTEYTYSIKAKDEDGNMSAPKEITFSTLDNVFCEEEVLPGTAQEFANQKLTFTAKKVSDTETYFAISSSTSTLTKISTVTFYNNTGETGTYGGGVLPDGYVLKDGWTLTDNTLSKTVTWTTYPTAPFRASINATRSKNSDTEKAMINWMYTMDVSNTCETQEPELEPSTYCQTPLTVNGTTIYLSTEKVSEDNYRLTIEGEGLVNVHGTYFNPDNTLLTATTTTDTKIVCEIAAASAPKFYTPIHMDISGKGEVSFTQVKDQDIVWGKCEVSDLNLPDLSLTTPSTLSHSLAVGETFTIGHSTSSTGAITYTSSNTSVAEVSAAGVITAKAIGSTTITVSQAEDANYQAGEKSFTLDVIAAAVPSNKGFGTFQGRLDLYNIVDGYAGTDACGQVDLYVVTWGNDMLYKAKLVNNQFIDNGTGWRCQLRTKNAELSDGVRETWAIAATEDGTTRYTLYGNLNNTQGLNGYGETFKVYSYMTVKNCAPDERTIKTLTYTRDHINNPISDNIAPTLPGAANVTSTAENVTIALPAVTSEEVFYMIKDEAHNKQYISITPSFVLPQDGSGITYTYSCYAVDFNGNISAPLTAEVSMEFNATSNLALNKSCQAGNEEGTNIASNANDGKNNTLWASGVTGVTNIWWYVDLGESYNLSTIEISWEGACANDYVIKASDEYIDPANASAWESATTLVHQTEAPTTGENTQIIHNVTSNHARYLRLQANSLSHNGAYGGKIYEFRVFGTGVYDPDAAVDTEKPSITSATPKTPIAHNEAQITMVASDNVGIVSYEVKDDAKGVSATCVPVDNVITVSNLQEQTTYNLSIVAVDAVGNKSDAYAMAAFTTGVNPYIPHESAPVPNRDAEDVLAFYSDAYTPVINLWGKNQWTGVNFSENNIAGNNYLHYAGNITNLGWEYNVNAGYTDGEHTGVNCSEMEYLHIDIWGYAAGTIRVIPIYGGTGLQHNEGYHTDVEILAGQWNSVDIALADFEGNAHDFSSIYQFKFTNCNNTIAIDNVYFWKPAGTQPVESVTLDKTTATIEVEEALQLNATVLPMEAGNKNIIWTSSNETVATVSAEGVVTGLTVGTTTITATSEDNNEIKATCEITVEPITVKTWWGGFKTFTVAEQEYTVLYSFTRNLDKTITYTVLFDKDASSIGVKQVHVPYQEENPWRTLTLSADNKTASWTSSSLHNKGEEITGYFYFGIVLEFDFSYIVGSSNERPTITVESVTLDKTSCELMPTETAQLVATVNPGYVANKNVVWTSSNTAVATVDANGLVTAVAAGSATITATSAADNTKTATCTVNVMAELTDATYYANAFFIENGRYVGFNYSITRTAERKLRYEATVNGNVVGLVVEFNDGNWHNMAYDADSKSYSYTTDKTYADGITTVNHFFYVKFNGGAQEVDADYTVGYANLSVPTMVAINESDEAANTALTGNIDAVIGRAFTNAYWQTISLPFALNQEQLKEVFGNGVQVAKLNSSRVASTDNATFELNFEYVSEIEAATPYLIRPSKEVAKGAVVKDVQADLTLKEVLTTDATMIPVLFKTNFPIAETNYWLAENGYLYGGATVIEAMRAYFTFPNLTAEQASRMRARVVFNENTETSVDNITIDESAVKVIQNGQLIIIRNGEKYNVQGQKL